MAHGIMPNADYVPLSLPVVHNVERSEEPLSKGQKDIIKCVVEHFQDSEYLLPGTEDGKLWEEERYWLVSCPGLSVRWTKDLTLSVTPSHWNVYRGKI